GLWRVPETWLEQAQDDATIVAIRDMERADIDIISDGEIRRESYSNHFATALEGVDVAQPAVITDRYGNPPRVPRIPCRVRCAGDRSSSVTCSPSAATPTVPPRSPCRVRSPWPSRRRTSSTATSTSSLWTSPSP